MVAPSVVLATRVQTNLCRREKELPSQRVPTYPVCTSAVCVASAVPSDLELLCSNSSLPLPPHMPEGNS